MTGKTNATTRPGFVNGVNVLVSHSAGSSGLSDHGIVEMTNGKEYRLLEIKQSGTLTFEANQVKQGIKGDVCVVNGGQGGGSNSRTGGCGAKLHTFYSIAMDALTIVIGAGTSGIAANGSGTPSKGGTSSFLLADAPEVAYMPAGAGSGRGSTFVFSDGISDTDQYGDGLHKYPFYDAACFNPHCGGGGAGGYYETTSANRRNGGAGGTNGGNGTLGTTGGSSGGAAGNSSAGSGGSGSGPGAGGDASYYGGAGGGGGYRDSTGTSGKGGNGYAGVVWIRIPA